MEMVARTENGITETVLSSSRSSRCKRQKTLGAFGVVKLAVRKSDQEQVVIKQINTVGMTEKERQEAQNEVGIQVCHERSLRGCRRQIKCLNANVELPRRCPVELLFRSSLGRKGRSHGKSFHMPRNRWALVYPR
eukprot:1194253-Prorocentrum_minimum.AAC.2